MDRVQYEGAVMRYLLGGSLLDELVGGLDLGEGAIGDASGEGHAEEVLLELTLVVGDNPRLDGLAGDALDGLGGSDGLSGEFEVGRGAHCVCRGKEQSFEGGQRLGSKFDKIEKY